MQEDENKPSAIQSGELAEQEIVGFAGQITYAEIWTLTLGLRWSDAMVLQQCWQERYTGRIEWRGVPHETD